MTPCIGHVKIMKRITFVMFVDTSVVAVPNGSKILNFMTSIRADGCLVLETSFVLNIKRTQIIL